MTEPASSENTVDGVPIHRWLPPAGQGPGLVLLQEIFGVSDYIRRRAADLAALGYVVSAPELYWRLGPDAMADARRDDLSTALQIAGRIDWDLCVADAVQALGDLRQRPEVTGGAGLIGFCFGGGVAFQAAAIADPDALVCYYGSSLPNLLDLADQVRAPSLYHFGLADSFLPPETVRRIEQAVATRPDVEFATYPGADHAFDNPLPAFHHPAASAAAWDRTVGFLARVLPVDQKNPAGDRLPQ